MPKYIYRMLICKKCGKEYRTSATQGCATEYCDECWEEERDGAAAANFEKLTNWKAQHGITGKVSR